MQQNKEVIKNLWRKKELLENGDPEHKKIKPLLLILGGGNRGVISSASCYALQTLGLGNVFDTVVGISTGAWVGGYFLAGLEQIKTGVSIYYEDFATSEYISIWKAPLIMNARVIEYTTFFGPKKLDMVAVLKSRSNFFAGVTDLSGDGHIINVKKAIPSPWRAMYASSANPLAYKAPFLVNGTEYIDGGIALSFPMKKVVEDFNSTDVLVLPNQVLGENRRVTTLQKLFVRYFFSSFPKIIREKVLCRHMNDTTEATYANTLENVFVLWPEMNGIKTLTKNPKILKAAAVSAVSQTLNVFGKPNLKADLH